jgi:beta-aspartyl-peptidase (threonine type)
VLGADGTIVTPFNTDGMFRAWVGVNGEVHVAIYADEDDSAD